jgi:hypothetical protein
VEVGETPLEDVDVKGPGVGVAVGLALLAMQTGLGPGCQVSSKSMPHKTSREAGLPGCEIL